MAKTPSIKGQSFLDTRTRKPAAASILGTDEEENNNTLEFMHDKTAYLDLHRPESFYIENDLWATLRQARGSNKRIKSKIINQALREFFEKNDIAIVKYEG